MYVLSISLDGSIADKGSEPFRRQAQYAEFFDGYTVITKTKPGEGKPIREGPIQVIPTRSSNRYVFLLDAYRHCARICRQNPVDVLTVQDPFAVGFLGWLIARRYGLRLHTQVHTDFLNNQAWLRSSWKHRIYDRLARFVLSRSDAIRVGTTIGEEKIRNLVPDDIPIHVVPVRMALDELVHQHTQNQVQKLREELNIGDRLVVLFVGRFVDAKNLPKWLNVANHVEKHSDQDPVFLLVGDGPLRNEIEQQISELNLENLVRLPGWIERDNLGAYYQVGDVFLITSKYEGTSRVIIEAGMNQLPVVTTPFAGAKDNIQDGKTGFIASETKKLSDQIIQLLESDNERERIGRAAQEYLKERFDSERLVEHYVEFLRASDEFNSTSEDKQVQW